MLDRQEENIDLFEASNGQDTSVLVKSRELPSEEVHEVFVGKPMTSHFVSESGRLLQISRKLNDGNMAQSVSEIPDEKNRVENSRKRKRVPSKPDQRSPEIEAVDESTPCRKAHQDESNEKSDAKDDVGVARKILKTSPPSNRRTSDSKLSSEINQKTYFSFKVVRLPSDAGLVSRGSTPPLPLYQQPPCCQLCSVSAIGVATDTCDEYDKGLLNEQPATNNNNYDKTDELGMVEATARGDEKCQRNRCLRLPSLLDNRFYELCKEKLFVSPLWSLDDDKTTGESSRVQMNGFKKLPAFPASQQSNCGTNLSMTIRTSSGLRGRRRGSKLLEGYWNPPLGLMLSVAKRLRMYKDETEESCCDVMRAAAILSKIKDDYSTREKEQQKNADLSNRTTSKILDWTVTEQLHQDSTSAINQSTKETLNREFKQNAVDGSTDILAGMNGDPQQQEVVKIEELDRDGISLIQEKGTPVTRIEENGSTAACDGENENQILVDNQASSSSSSCMRDTCMIDTCTRDTCVRDTCSGEDGNRVVEHQRDETPQTRYSNSSDCRDTDDDLQTWLLRIDDLCQILESEEIRELLREMERADPYSAICTTTAGRDATEKFKILTSALELRRHGFEMQFAVQHEQSRNHSGNVSYNEQQTASSPSSLILCVEPEQLNLLISQGNVCTRNASQQRTLLSEAQEHSEQRDLLSRDSPMKSSSSALLSSPPSSTRLTGSFSEDQQHLHSPKNSSYQCRRNRRFCSPCFTTKRHDGALSTSSTDDLKLLTTFTSEDQKKVADKTKSRKNDRSAQKHAIPTTDEKHGSKKSSNARSGSSADSAYSRRAGRPKVNRFGCKCLLCNTYQTPQWRFMTLFDDDEWMDLVCNACYMKFNGSRPHYLRSGKPPPALPELHNIEKPVRPTLEEYKMQGPAAWPYLMKRNDSKQIAIVGRPTPTSTTTPDVAKKEHQQQKTSRSKPANHTDQENENKLDVQPVSTPTKPTTTTTTESSVSRKHCRDQHGRFPNRISVTRGSWHHLRHDEKKVSSSSSSSLPTRTAIGNMMRQHPHALLTGGPSTSQSSTMVLNDYRKCYNLFYDEQQRHPWFTNMTHPSQMPYCSTQSLLYGGFSCTGYTTNGLNYSPTVLPLQSYHSYQDPPSISTPNSRRLIRDDGSRPNFTDTLPTSLLSHSYIHPVDSVSSAASRSIVMGYEEGSTNAVQVGAPVRDRQYYHEAMELLSQSGSSLVNGGAPNRPVFPA